MEDAFILIGNKFLNKDEKHLVSGERCFDLRAYDRKTGLISLVDVDYQHAKPFNIPIRAFFGNKVNDKIVEKLLTENFPICNNLNKG